MAQSYKSPDASADQQVIQQLQQEVQALRQLIKAYEAERSPQRTTPQPAEQQIECPDEPGSDRFRTIFDQTFQFIGLLNPDGTLVEVNRAALTFGGLTRSQAIGQPFWQVRWWTLSAETQTRLQRAIAQARSGEFVRYEVEVLGTGNTSTVIDFSIQPVQDEAGQVRWLVAEGRDICELKQAEDTLNSFFDSASMMMGIVELIDNEDILHIRDNAAVARFFGTSPEQMRQKRASDMGASSNHIQTWIDYYRESERLQAPVRFEYSHQQGIQEHWLAATVCPIKANLWAVPRFSYIVEDITERKRAEAERRYIEAEMHQLNARLEQRVRERTTELEAVNQRLAQEIRDRQQIEAALRQSEQQFRQMAETVNDVFWLVDMDEHRILYASPAYETIWGRPLAGLYHTFSDWIDAIHPDDREAVRQGFYEAVLDGEFDTTYRVVRPDGSIRWVRDRGYPVRSGLGRVYRVAGLAEDITDRVAAETALRESEARLRLFAESDLIGILFGDIYGGVHIANDEFLRIIGYSRDDLEAGNVRWDAMTPPEYLPLDAQKIAEAQATGRCIPYEKEYIRRDGSRVAVVLGYILLGEQRDESVVFILDISDRKRFEMDLQQRAAELTQVNQLLTQTTLDLERRNRELDKFAYVGSHDLKAPLRAISNLSEWIEDDVGDQLSDDSKYHLQLLRKRVNRMEMLIVALLKFSRAGRITTPPEEVDVNALLADVLELLTPVDGLTIHLDSMPTLTTQPQSLHQVFFNLIGNAIKHGDRHASEIWVTVKEWSDHYEFRVADNGPGIDPRYHDKIFEIFQTLKPRDELEAAGIGLSLAKKLVEAEGGSIWLESAVGEGATFYFTWPK